MKPERIAQLLPMVGSKKTGMRTGWVLATCPFRWRHDGVSKAFAVSFDAKKKSRCKCLSCGYSGDLEDLLMDLNWELKKHPEVNISSINLAAAAQIVFAEFEEMELTHADIPDYEAPVDKHEVPFPEMWLDKFKSIWHYPDGLAYCQKRGIHLETLRKFDVRFDPAQRRVCFPFRNFKGELMGMQGRHIDNIQFKDELHPDAPLRYYQYGHYGHRNMHIWMNENNVNLDETVILCEGPFDLLKIAQVNDNVAASFTSGLSMTKVKRMSDADSILTFYDHGKGGDAARGYIHKYLKGYPITDVVPTEEQGDAGAMPTHEILAALQPHVHVTCPTQWS